MRIIKFSSYPGGYLKKIELLTMLGVKYKITYVSSTVPCQTKVVIKIKVNTDLEYYAVLGAMYAV